MYFTGIFGTLLIVFRILGMFVEFPLNDLWLYLGISCLTLFLVLFFTYRIMEQRRVKKIIASNKNGKVRDKAPLSRASETTGWNMNNSPFRKRKTGITWGGGNIKGATATRGTKKPFLKNR